MARTRKRDTAARKFAKAAMKDERFRKAKHPCPACGFDLLLYSRAANILCLSCGLGVPADMVYDMKTGCRVEF